MGFSDFLAEIYAPHPDLEPLEAQKPPLWPVPPKDLNPPRVQPPLPSPNPWLPLLRPPPPPLETRRISAPCPNARLCFPLNAETLPTSGVPVEYISARFSDGSYGCLWEDCDHKSSSRPAIATHIRRKHLGIALGCKLCPAKQFFKHGSWQDHMKKSHPGGASC